jgi:hypothetical protein
MRGGSIYAFLRSAFYRNCTRRMRYRNARDRDKCNIRVVSRWRGSTHATRRHVLDKRVPLGGRRESQRSGCFHNASGSRTQLQYAMQHSRFEKAGDRRNVHESRVRAPNSECSIAGSGRRCRGTRRKCSHRRRYRSWGRCYQRRCAGTLSQSGKRLSHSNSTTTAASCCSAA